MSTVSSAPRPAAAPPPDASKAGEPARRSVRIDVVTAGLLLSAVGIGWLVDRLGVDVPWRLAVPVALVVVGAILVVTVIVRSDGGRYAGRSGLAWLGAGLLVVSLALGVDASRYVAPMGNVNLAPTATEWPVTAHRSAGNVEVDLTRHPLPDRGTLEVRVGAGNVNLAVPTDTSVRVDVRVTAGQIRVDGRMVKDGVDLQWSSGTAGSPVVVSVEVAAGEVTIRHA